jgi:nucleoside-diphosphate-sugar epimerase
MRIIFTGGTGKAGRHVVPWLVAQGHRVLNVDLVPLAGHPDNLIADITDSGQMFNAMSGYFGFDELEPGEVPKIDAVVHFAAVPRILLTPDNECFRVNTIGTYNVIEAAVKLGIAKIIVASSETVYGVCFAKGRVDPPELPITEDSPTEPTDSYAMSKLVNEQTAAIFQRRSGADIYALRIGNVIEPHEYAEFPRYVADPGIRRRNHFGYVDARDLGQIVDCCLKTDGLGYQVFNAGNDENNVNRPTADLARDFFPTSRLTRPFTGHEAPMSNEKIRKVLGFREEHSWRNYVTL